MMNERMRSIQTELTQQRLLIEDRSRELDEANKRAAREQHARETEQKRADNERAAREEAEAAQAAEKKRADEAEAARAETQANLEKQERLTGKIKETKRGPDTYPDETFYTAANPIMAANNTYKFGIVTTGTPEGRLSSYKCGYDDPLPLKFALRITTKNARAVEKVFREIFRPYLKDPKVDIVPVPFHIQAGVARLMAASVTAATALLVDYEANIAEHIMREPPALEDGPTEEKALSFICSNAWCGRKFAIGTRFNKHVDACKPPEPPKKRGRKPKDKPAPEPVVAEPPATTEPSSGS